MSAAVNQIAAHERHSGSNGRIGVCSGSGVGDATEEVKPRCTAPHAEGPSLPLRGALARSLLCPSPHPANVGAGCCRSLNPKEGTVSTEPDLKYMHPDSEEFKEAEARRLAEEQAERARRDEQSRRRERADWLQLYRIYERCVEIAEVVWGAKLETASAQQQTLAEQMRDRMIQDPSWPGPIHHEIPVPLFTPRDRIQFIKEVAVSLNISAEHKGLTVLFPKEKPGAPEESQTSSGPGIEAASGTSEETVESETANESH
jgi:hypothetical protein